MTATESGRAHVHRAAGLPWIAPLVCLLLAGCLEPQKLLQVEEKDEEADLSMVETVGDVTFVSNAHVVMASGVGLVTGLSGTGGGTPPGDLRTLLEQELRKRRLPNVKAVLDSPENAMVSVAAEIPPGVRKGDPLDVVIDVPQHSRVTSLRGGYLEDCHLRNYESSHRVSPGFEGADKLLQGHVIARARGPLLVGLDRDGDNGPDLRKARIWDGAVSLIDRPYYLVLNKDRKLARVANSVAETINGSFQDGQWTDRGAAKMNELMLLGRLTDGINDTFRAEAVPTGEIAKAVSKDVVFVHVPWEYRLNPKRYLRVVRMIPLQQTADVRSLYRHRVEKLLLRPEHTIAAALRLEALGKESQTALRAGLKAEHPLVRFASAEALAYMGNPAGVEELRRLGERHGELRAYCLTALASLDEPSTRMKLRELLDSDNAETRYGAFRALQLLRDGSAPVRGELLGEAFHLHKVGGESAPMVHFSLHRRAEVVLFGRDAYFRTPLAVASREFNITAAPGDDRCTVSRFDKRSAGIARRQCSLKVEDVLRTMAELGAEYPDVVELLRVTGDGGQLTCNIYLDAVPQPMPVEELADAGKDPGFLKGAGRRPAAARPAAATAGTAGPGPEGVASARANP